MRTTTFLATAALGLAAGAAAQAPTFRPAGTRSAAPKAKAGQPIDVVVCLDTSGSMRGLIDSARQNIWAIVNDLALAKPTPKLRIGLLTFGNTSNPKEDGWVKVETGLTQDLDLVSERLFKLATGGGDEYVGRVVDAATQRLTWASDPKALKIMIVAGNESADQDKVVSFRDACKAAIAKDILINAIYCGDPKDANAPAWRQVAKLADGRFASIDKDQKTVIIPTPFDNKLKELSSALNPTYVAYGQAGFAGKLAQSEQDTNAIKLNPQAIAQRAVTKSCSNYLCSWDLVTNYMSKKVKIEDVPLKDLPENMRKMTLAERKAYIADMMKTRTELQKKIADINVEREAWLVKERAKRADETKRSFEFEVRRAVRDQAEARGFRYAGC